MSARKSSAEEPPLPRQAKPAVRLAVVKRTAAAPTLKGRRGRLSHDEYAKAVAAVLRADLLQLEECAILGPLPGVRSLAARQTRSVFPTGAAIRALLDRAVGEVVLLSLNQRDPASQRIAWFLQLWYKEGRTVVAAAEVLELGRSYVAHTVQPRALDLVAKHFLDLAWRVEASA